MADGLFRNWSRVLGDIRDANSVRCPESLPETLAVLSRMQCRGLRESREGTALTDLCGFRGPTDAEQWLGLSMGGPWGGEG